MNNQEFIIKKDNFLLMLKKNGKISNNTYKSYECDLNRFLQYWQNWQKNNPDKIKEDNFENIANNFIRTLSTQNALNSTIARRISCFNSFKKFLKMHNISVNYEFKRPFVNTKNPLVIENKDILHILNTIDNQTIPSKRPIRDKCIISILFATGVLVSELSNIEIKDINFIDNSIIIRKKNNERIVYFDEKTKNNILNYINNERIPIKDSTEKLLLNYSMGALTPRSIQRICLMFRQFLSPEIKNMLTPGLLRNSFACNMLSNGNDLETVQKLLGHKISISTQRFKNKILSN